MPKNTFLQLPKEKQERVLLTATRIFARRGFAAADMAYIAEEAAVAKGSLYNYFESKEDLYLFVCRAGVERSRRAVYGGIEPGWDVYMQVEHIFRKGTAFALEHPEHVLLYLNVSSAGMERFAEQLTVEVEKHTADHLKKSLRKGIREGIVRSEVDPKLAAFLINSVYIMFLVSLISRHFQIRMKEYLEIAGELTVQRIEEPLDRVIAMIHGFLRPPAHETGGPEDPRIYSFAGSKFGTDGPGHVE